MSNVAIVTDSTAYVPKELVKSLNITEIPLYIIWGEETYKDNVDITPKQFYIKLQSAKVMPSTSQPSPQEFIGIYKPLLDKGKDILSIHISSKLSGTVDSAVQAKKMLASDRIEIVDSLSTTMALGLIVLAAARAAKKDKDLQTCKNIAEKARANTDVYFVVDTLEFLKRGGRIGGATALLGSALKLKPILYVKDGSVETYEKVRTKKKAIQRLVDICVEKIGNRQPVHLSTIHANSENEAETLKKELEKRFETGAIVEMLQAELSPVIGNHVGPGTVAVSFMVGVD
ncbi:MAG TPA: DegV family protein [Anaerolineae bacterium]|nr:DegV family protein [Anaerolineae bacterium]